MSQPQCFKNLSTPAHYTSTHNENFRDKHNFISPNPKQTMYHYSNAYDHSHWNNFNKEPEHSQRSPSPKSSNEASFPPISPTNARQLSPTNARQRDLWQSQTKQLTGVNNNRSLAKTQDQVLWQGRSDGAPMASRQGYGGFSGFDGQAAVAAIDKSKLSYYVPGYAGHVRGIQFKKGSTFGKTTRACLNHPTECPLEP